MISEDENALICDFAETYHVYDYKVLPPGKVAVLALGLRDDSRIKMKLSGQKVTLEVLLLAGIADRLSNLNWAQTRDGQKGVNKPVMLVDMLTGGEKETDVIVFDSGEDFDKTRDKLIRGGE